MLIECSESISWFASIREQWEKIHIEIAEKFDNEDGPFRHTELTQVSMLAGAVVRAGGLAFEEFQGQKNGADSLGERRSPKRKSPTGRVDLGFFFNEEFYLAEAKLQCPNLLAAKQNPIDDALKAIKESVSDTEKSLRGFRDEKYPFPARGLAVTFLLPHFLKDKEKIAQEKLASYEAKLVAAARSKGVDLIASLIIKPGWLNKEKNHLYSRLYMLIKEV